MFKKIQENLAEAICGTPVTVLVLLGEESGKSSRMATM